MVRRYLQGGEEAAVREPVPKRSEKLDSFKEYIVERLKAATPDVIPAAVLFREIKARGYDGGLTRVKDFVRGLRPAQTIAGLAEVKIRRSPASSTDPVCAALSTHLGRRNRRLSAPSKVRRNRIHPRRHTPHHRCR
jgi:hypothetical protein